MSWLWEIIKAAIVAAEEKFTDPKTGPAKRAWAISVLVPLITPLCPQWLQRAIPTIIGALIDVAVAILNARGELGKSDFMPTGSALPSGESPTSSP